MCIIFACTEGKPDVVDLRMAARSNPHGAGLAWLEGGKVRWKKGIQGTPEQVAAEVDQLVREKPLPLLIHFRVATIGGPIAPLTHPFPINGMATLELEGSSDSVLMHNGHWGEWRKECLETRRSLLSGLRPKNMKAFKAIIPEGPWSDSRAMAWNVAHLGPGYLDLKLEDQKVIIMDKEGHLRYTNSKAWYQKEKEGFMHSAPLFRPSENVSSRLGKRVFLTDDPTADGFWTERDVGADEEEGTSRSRALEIFRGGKKVDPEVAALFPGTISGGEALDEGETKRVALADTGISGLAGHGMAQFTQADVEFVIAELLDLGKRVGVRR